MAQTVYLKLEIDGIPVEGESAVTSLDRRNTIECSAFYYGVATPRDAATGKIIGKRQHEPVRILKRVDKSTPLLLKAMCRNESVNLAQFMFFRPSITAAPGAEEHFFTVLLEEGYIAGVDLVSEDAIAGGEDAPPMMEEVAFVFQNITWTYEIGSVEHQDSWQGE